MVRFKVIDIVGNICTNRVSIPIWFDLKHVVNSGIGYVFPSFNSYMVRFKAWYNLCICKYFIVSIPIWFDLKKELSNHYDKDSRSFNSYMVRFKERCIGVSALNALVSIPIWFDLKRRSVLTSSENGCVSIPIWFDLKRGVIIHLIVTNEFQFLYGSI